MIQFDKPIQTKSGNDIVAVWGELQECWVTYKKARSNHDFPTMREYAKRIRDLQADIGLKQAEFPELKTEQIKPT